MLFHIYGRAQGETEPVCVCACVFRDALLLRTTQEEMVALLHTNLLGTMLTCRAALRSMLRTEGAAIVNIGADIRDLFFVHGVQGEPPTHSTSGVHVMCPVLH